MKTLLRSKLLLLITLVCLMGSIVLIAFNFSRFEQYQMSRRNEERKDDVAQVLAGVNRYIDEKKNLPTVSSLGENTFLPEILFDGGVPSGGVSIQSLENVEGFVTTSEKDAQGNTYFIGTFQEQIIVYTTSIENKNGTQEVYFETSEITTSTVEAE